MIDFKSFGRFLAAACMLLACHVSFAREGGINGAQEYSYGVINFSASYLRQAPDYESALETQELMGVEVKILDRERYWLKVECPQPYIAWCTDKGVVEMTFQEMEAYRAAPKCICTADISHVYRDASARSGQICDLVMGDLLRYGGQRGRRGFTSVMLPDGRCGFVRKDDIADYDRWQNSRKADGDVLVATAKAFVGIPYLWGGMTPKGFDCSGLVRLTYLMNGISLPRNASQMVRLGVEVEKDSLQPGDLLFFGSAATDTAKERVTHVGMYIGGGKFIHSSHMVRINSMDRQEPDCYENFHRLLRCRRILP